MACYHGRMGNIVHQDLALSIDVMIALVNLLDREFQEAEIFSQQFLLAQIGYWMTCSFVGGFQGEEMPQ